MRAALIFENEIVETTDDREDYGELRYVALGHVGATVYRVVYTRPDDRTVHIISRFSLLGAPSENLKFELSDRKKIFMAVTELGKASLNEINQEAFIFAD